MGLLRLILALSVVAGHTQSTIFGFNGIGATYAVQVFFVISGFYMAMILNEKYKSLPAHKFYISRALRIYPVYFIGLALSMFAQHEQILATFNSLSTWSKLYMFFSNIFIFGRDLVNQFCWQTSMGSCEAPMNLAINPPGWSLAPELMFYLAAPFVVRSVRRVIMLFCIGCLYFYIVNNLHYPINWIGVYTERSVTFVYTFFPASIFFFLTGVIGYHFINKREPVNYFASLMLIFTLSFTESTIPSWVILLLGFATPTLFSITKDFKYDRMIGELSYPVYIIHFPIYIIVKNINKNSLLSTGTIVTLVTLALSLLVYFFVDRKIELIRHSKNLIDNSSPSGQRSNMGNVYVISYAMMPVIWVTYLVWLQ